MEQKIKFAIVSKNFDTQLKVRTTIKNRADIVAYNEFSKFMVSIFATNPSIVFLDARTININEDILEIFSESELQFISSVLVYSNKLFSTKSENIFSVNDVDLESQINYALLQNLKFQATNVHSQNFSKLTKRMNRMLSVLGFQTKHIGTTFLKKAIEVMFEHQNGICSFNKSLYPNLAKEYKTELNNVERNIRNSIKQAYRRTGSQSFNEVLKNDFSDGFPPNREFITCFCDVLLNEDEKLSMEA